VREIPCALLITACYQTVAHTLLSSTLNTAAALCRYMRVGTVDMQRSRSCPCTACLQYIRLAGRVVAPQVGWLLTMFGQIVCSKKWPSYMHAGWCPYSY
jgi:hypothetical protein